MEPGPADAPAAASAAGADDGPSGRSFALLLGCFLLSGFAALLYETAWTREFAFVFGSSELAVATVLAAYMGGLAAGAAAAARLAPRLRRPVLAYAVLELGIGLCALAIPGAIRASTVLYVRLFGAQQQLAVGAAGTLFQLACAAAILLVPTALMGATLPLLARHAVRRRAEIGRRVGTLYAVNTAGAIAGTLCAAFALMPAVGLRRTVYVGALANLCVFALAALLARRAPAPAAEPERAGAGLAARWLLPLLALAGAASFSYEVLWTRLLAHLLGGSVQAFATMLASFLAGIAAGSALASWLARDRQRALSGFALAQLGAALLSLVAFGALDALPGLAARLGAGRSLAADALLAAAVLLPGAFAIGASFPFAVTALAREAADAARASGLALAWNTLGAIAGAVATGFLLLPALELAGTLSRAAALPLAIAAAAAAAARPRRRAVLALAIGGLAALLAWPPATPWRLLRSSPLGGPPAAGELSYFGVGRSATVLVLDAGSEFHLTTNGLPEAHIERPAPRPGRYLEAHWLGLLPALLRPGATSLLLVGLGGGVALEVIPPSVASIDVIELEPEVVEANRAIGPRRRADPLRDPRVRIGVDDARSALLLSGARWDAIVSQPSHPWTAGASHLYTREFFQLARERLAPGGVLVQWIGLALVDAELLRTLVATLLDVFPELRVYQPVPSSLYFVASDAPLAGEAAAAGPLAAAPPLVAERGVRLPEDVAATLVLDTVGARRFAAGAARNTDDHNRLASRAAGLGRAALDPAALRRLLQPFEPSLPPDPALDPILMVRRLAVVAGPGRARRAARELREAATRESALGWIALDEGRRQAAAPFFRRALELDPAAPSARAGLLAAQRAEVERGHPHGLALSELEAAVAAGWRQAALGSWDALRALDPLLAAADARDVLFAEAARLRVRWRVESGDVREAREALAILDPVLPVGALPMDFVLRARVAARAEEPRQAIASLEELALRLERGTTARGAARSGLAVLDAVAGVPERVRAPLRRRLQRLAQGAPADPPSS